MPNVVEHVAKEEPPASEFERELIIKDDPVGAEEVVDNFLEEKIAELATPNNNEPQLLVEKQLSPTKKVALYIQQSQKNPTRLSLSVKETDSELDEEPQSDSVLVRKRSFAPQNRRELGGSASKIARPKVNRGSDRVPTAAQFKQVCNFFSSFFENYIHYAVIFLLKFFLDHPNFTKWSRSVRKKVADAAWGEFAYCQENFDESTQIPSQDADSK